MSEMTLKPRISALMREWADAGDDLPEELLIIAKQQRMIEMARGALKAISRKGTSYSFNVVSCADNALAALSEAEKEESNEDDKSKAP